MKSDTGTRKSKGTHNSTASQKGGQRTPSKQSSSAGRTTTATSQHRTPVAKSSGSSDTGTSPTPSECKSKTKQIADDRISMLADRLAILLTICNARDDHEETMDWYPWALDRVYDDPGSMGDSIRQMRDYKIAKNIIRRWIVNIDKSAKG